MLYNVNEYFPDCELVISGASYAGAPVSNTVMYLSKKVENLLTNLLHVSDCLVFIEKGINIPEYIIAKHFVFETENPQYEYAKFLNAYLVKMNNQNNKLHYISTEKGYLISETASIGENVTIEPGCIIGHDVIIGDNAHIMAGAIVKNSIIGNNFICGEGAVIGAFGFTFTEDEQGNKFRIPSIGKVVIGDYVEIGANDAISAGTAGNTIIEDYAKLDALVRVSHDVQIEKNVEIAAGAIIGGFDIIGEETFVGMNAIIKNRVTLGKECLIGMGANAIRDVKSGMVVVGNPAKEIRKI
nr:DapH/DapD/GlmU-related protein [uncultured Eisenbergiella sp.]